MIRGRRDGFDPSWCLSTLVTLNAAGMPALAAVHHREEICSKALCLANLRES
jgi:hypothetical protein